MKVFKIQKAFQAFYGPRNFQRCKFSLNLKAFKGWKSSLQFKKIFKHFAVQKASKASKSFYS